MSTSATYAVNLPLTNYIIGWYGTQTHDPARFLAPGVKAPGLLTTYKRYLRQDAFAASDTRRPMYDSPRTIDIRGEDVPVMLEVSIPAPVWVRLQRWTNYPAMTMFQFTHPCGCDSYVVDT